MFWMRFFMILITISAPQQMTWTNNKITDRKRERERDRDSIVKEKQIELKTQFQFEINFSTELFSGRACDTSIKAAASQESTGAGGNWRQAMMSGQDAHA